MVDKPTTIGERQYNQINESINSINELVTRIDERVLLLMRNHKSFEEKIDAQSEQVNRLGTKISILETQTGNLLHDDIKKMVLDVRNLDFRTHSLETSSFSQENRWKAILSSAIQLVWVILAAYILYKLGISAPAVP